MSVKTQIVDGTGRGYYAKVDNYNTLWVRDLGIPPASDPNDPNGIADIQKVYREYLTRDGDGVTIDARVNASLANPIEFFVKAEPGFDIYITSLSFVIADNTLTLSQFGAIGALTNGCNLFYEDTNGITFIGQDLKTNFQFVRLTQGNPAWGDPTGAFVANNVVGSSEAVLPVLDFRKVFGLPYGLRLGASSANKLSLEIRDNVSTVDQFDIIAYGSRIRL